MNKVALIVGTYTGGGIGVVVTSLLKEARRLGFQYTVVTKSALSKSDEFEIIEIKPHKKSAIEVLKKFDVVHVMGGSTLVIPSLLCGKPTVFTYQGQTPPELHGGFKKNLKAFAIELLYKGTMKRFDVVTSASKFGQEDIRRRFGVEKSIWIPNGADRTLFFKTSNQEIAKIRKKYSHPIFLGVGSLYPVKGWDETLDYFEKYLSKRPSATLLIAGGGIMKKRMHKRIRGSRLNGHVKLLGELPLAELNNYYNACDAYLSGSPYEGFCLPAIEALACGKPLCVRKRGAMIEHALQSGCGAVFEDNAHSFIKAAEAVAAMKSADVKKKAKKYLVPFTWKNAARQYFGIYKRLLRKHGN
ncbi:MAG: glycosyltransferase [Candidatus Micrarchaeota archaeon]